MTTRPTAHPAPPGPADPPTLRLRDPAGVVAAVPYLLGFVPRRSLVVVGVDDDRGVGATMRTDLPTEDLLGAGPPEVLTAGWDHACRVLRRNGCSRALVVLHADVDPADLPDEAARRLLHVLDPPGPDVAGPHDRHDPHDRGDGAGRTVRDRLDVLDVLLVGPRRFRSLLCPDVSCCPVEGAPVDSTGSHPVAASFVLAGRSPAAGRDEVEPPPPPASVDERTEAALSAARARGTRPRGTAAALHDRRLLREWLACLPDGPSPTSAGRIASAWRSTPLLRDSCLAAFLPGGPELARHLLSGGTQPLPGSLAGSLGDPACARAVAAGAPVLRRMAALVPAPESADVLAAHAWLSWASGEGTAAAVLAGRALDVDPGQSLARLVLQCLDHGLGAPWTTRPAAERRSRPRRPPRGAG